MRTCNSIVCLVVISTLSAWSAAAEEKRAWAVPTFECLGLYYPSAEGKDACTVQYRPADEKSWRQALPLAYDPVRKEYRGSLVGLKPDAEYAIRLTRGEQTLEFSARTRSEQFPIGKTTHLPGGEMDKPVKITESGTADAWHLVTPTPGTKTVIDVFNLQRQLRRGGGGLCHHPRAGTEERRTRHAVLIRKGVQNVVVEDCHMTLWGRVGGAAVWGVSSRLRQRDLRRDRRRRTGPPAEPDRQSPQRLQRLGVRPSRRPPGDHPAKFLRRKHHPLQRDSLDRGPRLQRRHRRRQQLQLPGQPQPRLRHLRQHHHQLLGRRHRKRRRQHERPHLGQLHRQDLRVHRHGRHLERAALHLSAMCSPPAAISHQDPGGGMIIKTGGPNGRSPSTARKSPATGADDTSSTTRPSSPTGP